MLVHFQSDEENSFREFRDWFVFVHLLVEMLALSDNFHIICSYSSIPGFTFLDNLAALS